MKFNGKCVDIPNELYYAHKRGKVVFFCGAGTSIPCGLPGFKGLALDVYDKIDGMRMPSDGLEKELLDNKQYDRLFHLMEKRKSRHEVRLAVVDALTRGLSIDAASGLMSLSLLKLSKSEEGAIHLITTNYDNVLMDVAQNNNFSDIKYYVAPHLPVPRKGHWDGIVYLHGKIKDSEESLDELILTSGDFGRAYLTERWASRFITEICRHYSVCFVGYSLNDPIVRYVADAFAEDERDDVRTARMYAFSEIEDNVSTIKKIKEENKWKSMGINVIFYPVKDRCHECLYNTLSAWAEDYSSFDKAAADIIAKCRYSPKAPIFNDDAYNEIINALTKDNAKFAYLFNSLIPAPPIEWLDVFEKRLFSADDLPRFGVIGWEGQCDGYEFSMIDHPVPSHKAGNVSVFAKKDHPRRQGALFEILFAWLSESHLGNVNLIRRLLDHGCGGNLRLEEQILTQLGLVKRLLKANNQEELNKLLSKSKYAIPSEEIALLWDLYFSGDLCSCLNINRTQVEVSGWLEELKSNGLTTSLKSKFFNLSRVRLGIGALPAFYPGNQSRDKTFSFELYAGLYDVWHLARTGDSVEEFRDALPQLIPILEFAIDHAWALWTTVQQNGNNWRSDASAMIEYIGMGEKELGRQHWTDLVLLLRDAWVELMRLDKDRAGEYCYRWFKSLNPLFKRLGLYCGSLGGVDNITKVNWLTRPYSDVLLTPAYIYEVCALLVSIEGEGATAAANEISYRIVRAEDDCSSGFRCGYEKIPEDIRLFEKAKLLSKLIRPDISIAEEFNAYMDMLKKRIPSYEFTDSMPQLYKYKENGNEHRRFAIKTTSLPIGGNGLVDIPQLVTSSISLYSSDWDKICVEDPKMALRSCLRYGQVAVASEEEIETVCRRNLIKAMFSVWAQFKIYLDLVQCYAHNEISEEQIKELMMGGEAFGNWAAEIATLSSVGEDFDKFIIKVCSLLDDQKYLGDEEDINSTDSNTVRRLQSGKVIEGMFTRLFNKVNAENCEVREFFLSALKSVMEKPNDTVKGALVVIGWSASSLYVFDHKWTTDSLLGYLKISESKTALPYWQGLLTSYSCSLELLAKVFDDFVALAADIVELADAADRYIDILSSLMLSKRRYCLKPHFHRIIELLARNPRFLAKLCDKFFVTLFSIDEKDKKSFWFDSLKPVFVEQYWPKGTATIVPEMAGSVIDIIFCAPEQLEVVWPVLKPYIKLGISIKEIFRELGHRPKGATAHYLILDIMETSNMDVEMEPFEWREIKAVLDEIRNLKPGDPQYARRISLIDDKVAAAISGLN